MKMIFRSYLLLLLFVAKGHLTAFEESSSGYWTKQRRGANFFNQVPTKEWFLAAKQINIEFVRLAPDKWKGSQRDFLIGNADQFTTIPPTDLARLKEVLDWAHASDIKVVLTLLSLPGSRWRQNNADKDDVRLWQEGPYQQQAIAFWKELAGHLKNHPAIVGYNLLNEPHPECFFGFHDFRKINFSEWYDGVKETAADLNLFYSQVVQAIREVDTETPIILDAGLYATPWAIEYLQPVQEKHVLYAMHMYEPYLYTTRKLNQGKLCYPGEIPLFLKSEKERLIWDQKTLAQFFEPVRQWQLKHAIPSHQMLIGEFGCDRTVGGAADYLNDLLEIFEAEKWHWAFYAFREDVWDSMDYELGTEKPTWAYWQAVEKGESLDPFRKDNPIFNVLKRRLAKLP